MLTSKGPPKEAASPADSPPARVLLSRVSSPTWKRQRTAHCFKLSAGLALFLVSVAPGLACSLIHKARMKSVDL